MAKSSALWATGDCQHSSWDCNDKSNLGSWWSHKCTQLLWQQLNLHVPHYAVVPSLIRNQMPSACELASK
eukprot:5841527-Pleurochrysis_carterae.AAC.5